MKLRASLSLDLDDLWSYLKIRNDPTWQEYPTYLPRFLPELIRLLDELDLRITVFVVGRDAERSEVAPLLRDLAARGHELASHSYSHDSWMASYGPELIREEVERTENALLAAAGERPIGFRGPGFSWNPQLLALLAERGYLYDASTFPTFLAPLARMYYFRAAGLDHAERVRRRNLYGSWRDGFAPIRPYRWSLGARSSLVEIPVTTMPLVRAPFHMSYLLYLARYSARAMNAYFRTAAAWCRWCGFGPSFLLHPTDLIDSTMAPSLGFFPGMDVPATRKLELLRRTLDHFRNTFDVTTLATVARSLPDGSVATRKPQDRRPESPVHSVEGVHAC